MGEGVEGIAISKIVILGGKPSVLLSKIPFYGSVEA